MTDVAKIRSEKVHSNVFQINNLARFFQQSETFRGQTCLKVPYIVRPKSLPHLLGRELNQNGSYNVIFKKT